MPESNVGMHQRGENNHEADTPIHAVWRQRADAASEPCGCRRRLRATARCRAHDPLFAIECAITIGTVFLYGSTSQNWVASNWATAPTLVASVAATLSSNRWVQTVAIAVIMLLWIPYFVSLQGALS